MKLPDKPSKLLKLAMTDLEWVENNPNYVINMNMWHSPNDDDTCEVCHAGAVMAHSLKIPITKDYEFEKVRLGRCNYIKIQAIDEIRLGYVSRFFDMLETNLPESLKSVERCYDNQREDGNPDYYSSHPQGSEEFEIYKNWIVSFIGILEAEGL